MSDCRLQEIPDPIDERSDVLSGKDHPGDADLEAGGPLSGEG